MMVSPEMLRRFTLFAGLEPPVFKQIALMSTLTTRKQGEWLFHERQTADTLYLIVSGKIDLCIAVGDTEEDYPTLTTLREGEFFGWSSLIKPYVYRLDAIVLADAQLIEVDGTQLRDLAQERPEIGYLLMQSVAQVIADRLHNLRIRFVSFVGS